MLLLGSRGLDGRQPSVWVFSDGRWVRSRLTMPPGGPITVGADLARGRLVVVTPRGETWRLVR